MGYRVSKSEEKKIFSVKEQRVDGSYRNNLRLRYTLMDFERSYPIKNLSKLISNIKIYSTKKFYTTNTINSNIINP
jgi:hypothetical protein